jgi:hypothetical protein
MKCFVLVIILVSLFGCENTYHVNREVQAHNGLYTEYISSASDGTLPEEWTVD